MQVKICGLTSVEEASYLNEAGADYAGFVFYEKSKRNITIEKAVEIMEALDASIKRVAVMVSPTDSFIKELQAIPGRGFDILQIHKQLSTQVLEAATRPIWRAVNISDEEELKEKLEDMNSLPGALAEKITGIVVDAPAFGSGQVFNWHKSRRLLKAGAQSPPGEDIFRGRLFVLAGGLKEENVKEGISIFAPDVVDVSSGVEGLVGKEKEMVLAFVKAARE